MLEELVLEELMLEEALALDIAHDSEGQSGFGDDQGKID